MRHQLSKPAHLFFIKTENLSDLTRRRAAAIGNEVGRHSGTALAVFVIWNTVFFIVFQNTVLGVQLVPEVLEQGVRALGGGRLETIRTVLLPGALPYILTGIRSGLGFGWRALIAAELVGAPDGLGQMIFAAADYHRSDIIIAGCLIIGLIAIAMDRWLLIPIERRTVARWGLVLDTASKS